jgi:DnaJ domain
MKLNSKIFDGIRIKPRRASRAEPERVVRECAWKGCDLPGLYRAPKGHRADGEYHSFCLEHVRAYNKSFNYFAGLSPEEIEARLMRDAATGERPTWRMGTNGEARAAGRSGGAQGQRDASGRRFSDPLNIFARYARHSSQDAPIPRQKRLVEPDRRAFEALGLDGWYPATDIKRAYKDLVKKHHPDANGGDRASEDRLRAVIAAYTHLKTKGFV